MRINKSKSLSYAIIDDTGNQAANLHAEVRAGKGVALMCDIFDPEPINAQASQFDEVKAAFRAEVEELAAREGAVMI